MHRVRHLLLLSVLFVAVATLPARPAAAGGGSDFSYVWRIGFMFDDSFDGTLTIESGPMVNGVLQSVERTSTSVVPCARVGTVGLTGGMAKFDGGYLRCALDLAAALKAHGIEAPAIDSYNRVTVRAGVASTVQHLAPIVSHPDIAYSLDFTKRDRVALHQELATNLGVVAAGDTFLGLSGSDLRNYAYVYQCLPAGPCAAHHYAGAAVSGGAVVGAAVRFQTGPNTLLVGGDGASTFFGGIDELIIDPGNTIPGT